MVGLGRRRGSDWDQIVGFDLGYVAWTRDNVLIVARSPAEIAINLVGRGEEDVRKINGGLILSDYADCAVCGKRVTQSHQ